MCQIINSFHGDSVQNERAREKALERGRAPNAPPPACLGLTEVVKHVYIRTAFKGLIIFKSVLALKCYNALAFKFTLLTQLFCSPRIFTFYSNKECLVSGKLYIKLCGRVCNLRITVQVQGSVDVNLIHLSSVSDWERYLLNFCLIIHEIYILIFLAKNSALNFSASNMWISQSFMRRLRLKGTVVNRKEMTHCKWRFHWNHGLQWNY